MLNFPVFFISREKKYLGFPPRENVKKTQFFVIFLEIHGTLSEKNYGIQRDDSYCPYLCSLQKSFENKYI